MNDRRSDGLTTSFSALSSRRALCKAVGGGTLAAALTRLGLGEAVARCTKLKEKCGRNDTCCGDLKCGRPTTRHTCSSSIPKQGKWCCVKPGGTCTECDCCGDYYCKLDANNNGRCVRNPEGN